jgi:hypothetical protein
MTDFLTNLVGRTLGVTPTARPLIAPIYASAAVFPVAPSESNDSTLDIEELTLPKDSHTRALDTAAERRIASPHLGRPTPNQESIAPFVETDDTASAAEPLHNVSIPGGSMLVEHAANPASSLAQAPAHQAAENARQHLFSPFATDQPAQVRLDSNDQEALLVQPAFTVRAIDEQTSSPGVQRPLAAALTQSGAIRVAAQEIGKRTDGLTQQNGSPLGASVPTIQITIGRVEVRAVQPPSPAAQRQQTAPTAKISLEEYLRTQKGDRR